MSKNWSNNRLEMQNMKHKKYVYFPLSLVQFRYWSRGKNILQFLNYYVCVVKPAAIGLSSVAGWN